MVDYLQSRVNLIILGSVTKEKAIQCLEPGLKLVHITYPNPAIRQVFTFGPSPHFRGYVSRSIITLLILATTPWSQAAITAVVIRAIPG